MNKTYFVLKLLPNRPDFAETMSSVSYWKEYLDKGVMLVFGPVLDPKGVYGLGIIAVDNEEQVKTLIDNEPASAINKYEYHPMMAVVREK